MKRADATGYSDLPPDVIEAWQAAGATNGRMRLDHVEYVVQRGEETSGIDLIA